VGQSEKVYENNGDRAVFSAGCEMERSEDESAYGRERRHIKGRPLGAMASFPPFGLCSPTAETDRSWINLGYEMDSSSSSTTST
jgi:hypothetical protein